MKHIQNVAIVVLLSSLVVLSGCQEAGTSSSGPTAQVEELIGSARSYVLMTEPPQALLDRIRLLSPNDAKGAKVVDEFIDGRHPIVAYVIEELKDKKQIEESVARDIEERIAECAEPKLNAQETISMLELAAYADVNCHSLEYLLRVATLQHIQLHKDESEVREALEWIKSSYQSRLRTDSFRDTPDFVRNSLPQSMTIRMIEYADALLQAKTTDEALMEQTPARDRFKEPEISKRARMK